MLSGASIGRAALLSQKNLAESQGGLSSAIERLSSGLKINRAKDDATRSKVSLEITQQTRTLAAAALNAENAISMAATADSALSGIGDLLLRIKELAVKGRDQALSATQLKSVTDEMEQMLTQLPLGGSQYLKLWYDERLKRPCAEFLPIDNVIVPFTATNFYNAQRATEVHDISNYEYRQRVAAGLYRELGRRW